MATKMAKYLGLCVAAIALGTYGCSEGTDKDGTGGTQATGGGGGDDDAGGDDDTGGATATGGATNAGATNGDATNGGATNGGATNEGGTAEPGMLYDFAADVSGFALQGYTPDDAAYTNLAETDSETAASVTLEWDDAAGQDTQAGMLTMSCPFTGDNQFCDIQVDWGSEVRRYPGMTLHAWVMVESGLVDSPDICGGAILSVKTGADWVYGAADWKALCSGDIGQWTEIVFPLDEPASSNDGYSSTEVRAIGIQIASGSAATDKPVPTTAIVHIDSISIE